METAGDKHGDLLSGKLHLVVEVLDERLFAFLAQPVETLQMVVIVIDDRRSGRRRQAVTLGELREGRDPGKGSARPKSSTTR